MAGLMMIIKKILISPSYEMLAFFSRRGDDASQHAINLQFLAE
jgi:hypothetical protein